MSITAELLSMQDAEYKTFISKLVPNVNPDIIIGIRTPALRSLAKRTKDADSFLKELPHTFFEENNLHSFIIEQIKDFDTCINEIECFLPYIDNWATCDGMRPKCFKKNTDKLLAYIEKWLCSSHTYTVRFGIEMLMTYYLDEHFNVEFLERVSQIQSDEYYINMMIAWYFATALAKQWEYAVSYIEKKRLPMWVHKKTIQKAVESYRITSEQKQYLKSLKTI